MPLLNEKDHKGLLNRYPRRPLLQTLQSKRSKGLGIRPTIVRQKSQLTTREFLMLAGIIVTGFGSLLILLGDLPRQAIGVFVFVVGLLTTLSNTRKDAKKDIQKAFKTFVWK